ncbi:MAG: hypothetical protein WBE13_01850 [Candidatus Acidiferrum sp.]
MVQRNLKVLVFGLWVLSVAGTAFLLANHRNRLSARPARIVTVSTPPTNTPLAAATPTVSMAANPTPHPAAPADPADASAFIAFRYDQTHIAFRLRQEGDFDLSNEQARMLRKLPDPALKSGGADTWQLNENLLESLKDHFRAAHIGQNWQLELSGDFRTSAVIQKAVAFTWGCDSSYTAGFLAEIAPQDQAAFAASPNEYFLVHQSAGIFSVNSNNKQAHLDLLADWKPSPEVRAQIEQALEAKRKDEFYDERISGLFPDERARFAAQASLDKVKLDYDIKAVRVSPDGLPLLFIRARWKVDERTEFMPELWLHLGPTATVEPFEETDISGVWITVPDRLEADAPFTQPGAILNVFDRRGDGYGEVLVLFSGGDSYVIRLLRYTPKGLVPTTISMGDGC